MRAQYSDSVSMPKAESYRRRGRCGCGRRITVGLHCAEGPTRPSAVRIFLSDMMTVPAHTCHRPCLVFYEKSFAIFSLL